MNINNSLSSLTFCFLSKKLRVFLHVQTSLSHFILQGHFYTKPTGINISDHLAIKKNLSKNEWKGSLDYLILVHSLSQLFLVLVRGH